MTERKQSPGPGRADTLVVRRRIPARPETLFDAWTKPEQMKQWWGPTDVRCIGVEIDLCIGGSYKIANLLPDGSTLWIHGAFEQIERPHRLVYSWNSSPSPPGEGDERVEVRFEWTGSATEVTITHEKILNAAARSGHQRGWEGCLAGLSDHLVALQGE